MFSVNNMRQSHILHADEGADIFKKPPNKNPTQCME